jgi:hypothetical protein
MACDRIHHSGNIIACIWGLNQPGDIASCILDSLAHRIYVHLEGYGLYIPPAVREDFVFPLPFMHISTSN